VAGCGSDEPSEKIGRHLRTKSGIGLEEPGDVREVLLSLAGATLGVEGGTDLAAQDVPDGGDGQRQPQYQPWPGPLDELRAARVRLQLDSQVGSFHRDVQAVREGHDAEVLPKEDLDTRKVVPHVHALVTRGGWTASGEWVPVPYVSSSAAEQLFRHKVIRLLQHAGLLDEDRTRLLLSWHHSGFTVHNFVTVPAGDGRAFEALDFVARLLAHVPDPRRHLVHYYGAYSNAVRGKLKARGLAQKSEPLAPGPGEDAPPPACTSPSLAALRRGWAQLLRRVYELDPLVCPRCRGVMRVVSFITEGRVIHRILDHLGASARRATQERAPPPAAAAVPDSP
jgi:hypothetical protein